MNLKNPRWKLFNPRGPDHGGRIRPSKAGFTRVRVLPVFLPWQQRARDSEKCRRTRNNATAIVPVRGARWECYKIQRWGDRAFMAPKGTQ